jgi:hypothetical protein
VDEGSVVNINMWLQQNLRNWKKLKTETRASRGYRKGVKGPFPLSEDFTAMSDQRCKMSLFYNNL